MWRDNKVICFRGGIGWPGVGCGRGVWCGGGGGGHVGGCGYPGHPSHSRHPGHPHHTHHPGHLSHPQASLLSLPSPSFPACLFLPVFARCQFIYFRGWWILNLNYEIWNEKSFTDVQYNIRFLTSTQISWYLFCCCNLSNECGLSNEIGLIFCIVTYRMSVHSSLPYIKCNVFTKRYYMLLHCWQTSSCITWFLIYRN